MWKNELAKFVYYRTYSRYMYDKGRRENWDETVKRVVDYFKKITDNKLAKHDYESIEKNILNFDVMPSMRLMWTAGSALDENSFGAYNCSFLSCKNIDFFSELMFILMHGTGAGYSVEEKNISQLPPVAEATGKTINIVVEDSKLGWAEALRAISKALWSGNDVTWDGSKVRPVGTPLKTFGGRASGFKPLESCFEMFKRVLVKHRGRRLSAVNCHDLACKVAEVIVVGGVRRSALISLSDLHHEGMRGCKDGRFWVDNPQRSMANNSAVYYHKPTSVVFMEEWLSLAKSGSGERGIFNLSNIKSMTPSRRDYTKIVGSNPCAEIFLRDKGLCNLSEVVIRKDDTMDTLMEKVKVATMVGTIQSMLTNFGSFVSSEWKKNCEEERLLGVSLTGQMDNPKLLTALNLQELRDYAIGVNTKVARKLGINRSASITCTKPSGSVSQLCDSSSGFHPRFAPYYLRRVRISGSDPLYKMMKAQGVKLNPENGQTEADATTWVCQFPVASPKGSLTVVNFTAIQQLEQWILIKENWAEHTVSATIYVKPDEWLKVGNFVYENFNRISGVSFLPVLEHVYEQAPYHEITKEEYAKYKKEEVIIDYSKLKDFEGSVDMGEGASSPACDGDKCELKVK